MITGRYLIHDRDSKYTRSFDDILKSAGGDALKPPPRSPNLNAFAERFVKSIKTECTERRVLFGEKSLRLVVNEYIKHDHAQRNHQGIGNVIPFPDKRAECFVGDVKKAERLGGLLTYYHRDGRAASCKNISKYGRMIFLTLRGRALMPSDLRGSDP